LPNTPLNAKIEEVNFYKQQIDDNIECYKELILKTIKLFENYGNILVTTAILTKIFGLSTRLG